MKTSVFISAMLCMAAGAAFGQKTAVQSIEEYRAMLQDGNPAELFEAKGEDLWKKPRGPKNASLEKCDLGKGPGVVKGAFVELPRHFADTGRVQDLESRLLTCMEVLQGFNGAEIAKTPFGRGEQNNMTALATWIAAESKGMRFNLPQAHPAEKTSYEVGKRLFSNGADPMTSPAPHAMGRRERESGCRTCPTSPKIRVMGWVLPLGPPTGSPTVKCGACSKG